MKKIVLPHNHDEKSVKVAKSLPSNEEFSKIADAFKNLADASRVKIFWILCHAEECVINLSAMTSLSSPLVSHHLKQLKSSRLITSRREGKEVYYKASEGENVKALHEAIEKIWNLSCPIE